VKFPPQAPRKEPNILTAEAFGKLLQQLNGQFRTMVSVVALTGLRIGELPALRWRSLDLEEGTLQVRESVFQGQMQAPKSQKSVRTVPLGPVACRILKEHRAAHPAAQPEDLVFPNKRGGPHSESNLLHRVLRPAGEKAGLGRVTWHQFRHIHSTVLHDLNVPAKIAQQQLGHASVETTMKVYTHVVQKTHRKAIEDLEGVLFPNVPKLARARRGTAA
jgi:integrase